MKPPRQSLTLAKRTFAHRTEKPKPAPPRRSWWLNVKAEDFASVAKQEHLRMSTEGKAVYAPPMVWE